MDKEVRMGEIEVAKGEDTLIALGIGSCLVVTLYDPKQKIGALAHTMLPARRMSSESRNAENERRDTRYASPDTRYADIAIDEMLNKIAAQGAKKEFITAKLIGGANMFSAITSKIGEDNISYTRERLKKQGIPIVGECVGGSQGRSVEFSVASGIVTVKTKF
ncbi:MAG: chemotaxis protein CheD [Candidatus Omnitrophica bacterium]|nr:chemotaxis protein CheD [Candidatus Omnitrophota bacterium]MBU0878618.1 chemotaxis protein CheD [Candidatus Omnitrophota bacterium]MBU0896883.1 chemotaxis protein CheD [Candidatus Omnitrophota bacterium]MBU1524690.1 chemotaxis protein CheD [Candidatus Omnitrophota bacterium]MBU1810843.1 chemotaxis protein CheD [Candidatus Omnitrophota bacterium]